MQQDWNSLGLYEMGTRMEELKLKLLETRKKCECTDRETDDVMQLKDKGLFILKNFERKYESVNEELKDLHDDYVKCVSKVTSRKEIDYQEINFLTLQRDSLRQELLELKRTADENSKNLAEMWKIITAQEKKNAAMIRKLKRIMEKHCTNITQDLKERINAVLCDPRNTKTNVPNEKNE
ncbi:uncharacterized protein LOC143376293 [Andrena cerasifolii]|uniref:uncharacterized protein LOC143376293 n=1 Tax=Andrena cerasifolii TaxID=2819439 RepID=UPI00403799A5